MRRIQIGILGATGLVGQRLLDRLRDHPWFEVRALAASERSVGLPYAEAARSALAGHPPEPVARQVVRRCAAEALGDCDLLLSALDATAADACEAELRQAGFAIVSNSSAHRQDEDVPLVVPEINADHLRLLEAQRRRHGGGFIVTNPNCSAIGLALVLAPLDRAFGVRRAVATTLQAVSGAGLDGPRALGLVDNIVPYIDGEEEKVEREIPKILGELDGPAPRRAALAISAHCHRVPVSDGHLAALSVGLERPAGPAAATECLAGFETPAEVRGLPSAIERPILVREEPDRPQPRLDRDAGRGMAVVVGRVRACAVLGLKLELLSHNAIRGAAGGTLLLAELLAARGLVEGRAR